MEWRIQAEVAAPDHFRLDAVSHTPCAWRRIDVQKTLLIYEQLNWARTFFPSFTALYSVRSRTIFISPAASLATSHANALLGRGWIIAFCVHIHRDDSTIPDPTQHILYLNELTYFRRNVICWRARAIEFLLLFIFSLVEHVRFPGGVQIRLVAVWRCLGCVPESLCAKKYKMNSYSN